MKADSAVARRFLDRSMVVRLATLSAQGQPHITPLWFVSDGRRVYVTTRNASLAARDVTATRQVVMLFHGERAAGPARVLRVAGRAQSGRRLRLSVLLRFALKYHLSPGGLRNLAGGLRTVPARVRYYAERYGEAGVIEVSPESAGFLPGTPV